MCSSDESGVEVNEGGGCPLPYYNDPIAYEEDGPHMDLKRGFKPERWLNEETRPSADFIPMGVGPRYCLGSVLAYAEMQVFLATAFARSVSMT
jgi:hypothetical protein